MWGFIWHVWIWIFYLFYKGKAYIYCIVLFTPLFRCPIWMEGTCHCWKLLFSFRIFTYIHLLSTQFSCILNSNWLLGQEILSLVSKYASGTPSLFLAECGHLLSSCLPMVLQRVTTASERTEVRGDSLADLAKRQPPLRQLCHDVVVLGIGILYLHGHWVLQHSAYLQLTRLLHTLISVQ